MEFEELVLAETEGNWYVGDSCLNLIIDEFLGKANFSDGMNHLEEIYGDYLLRAQNILGKMGYRECEEGYSLAA